MNIARYLDHAVLKPEMTREEARAAIQQGIDYKVRTVCVRPCDVKMAVEMCAGSETEPICVLDFPHGCGGAEAKEALARVYASQGVAEIDMVMNYGAARGGDWDTVADEVRRVVNAAHAKGVRVKVIFETSQLTLEQISKGTEVCAESGADYVKTSTGFLGEGATVEGVRAMLDAAKGRIQVKASGGIRSYEAAKKFIDMGVTRLGVGYSTTKVLVEGQGEAEGNY